MVRRALLGCRDGHVYQCFESRVEPGEVWDALGGLRGKALVDSSRVGVRCTVPLSLIWELAIAAEGHARANSVTVSYTMSCGTGRLEAYGAGLPAALQAFAVDLRADAERLGGAMWVLDGWSALGREFDAWGSLRTDFELMRAVKQRFDPAGIMNPGRFVGRL